MADQDTNNTGTGGEPADAPAKKATTRRRASRPAGPPAAAAGDAPAAGGSDSPGDSGAAATAAKKTAKKSTAKKAAAKQAVAKKAAKASAAPTAAKKTTKKTAAKKTAKASGDRVDSTEPAAVPTVSVAGSEAGAAVPAVPLFQAPAAAPAPARRRATPAEAATTTPADGEGGAGEADVDADGQPRRRRRGGRGRGRGQSGAADGSAPDTGVAEETGTAEPPGLEDSADEADEDGDGTATSRRRRRRRRRGSGGGEGGDDPERTVVHEREPRSEVSSVKGSTRLEAKKQRRRSSQRTGRRRSTILTEAEFLARRESVERVMAVRDDGERTQIAVLEDGVLVEHYVDRKGSASLIGNVYLGRVQNVLPSMEAAFVDIGRGRNAVLYAGEVNWDAAGLDGQPKRIEHAMKSGDSVLVQVTKDPIGHKGARLTAQVTLPGRFLVYVPDGSLTGISRKLPDTERTRLKSILKEIVPEDAGVIVRTAAEGASEEELSRDVARLRAQWEDIDSKSKTATAPTSLYTEPDLTIRVVRDLFNEDFARLAVSGRDAEDTVDSYVGYVAADLAERVERWTGDGDLFDSLRVDEQLAKALERKVWLPSGGSLVIDRTEAMTVVDVNTGKFTGSGGNLEETVTRNNLEAAEEIVRQLRLRDIGGIIVIDFIDMVLEKNRDLVLRRLTECLARDRTKHQVAEVSSLGLVQMTRKRIGSGLLESFSEPCSECNGRGLHVHSAPVDPKPPARTQAPEKRRRSQSANRDEAGKGSKSGKSEGRGKGQGSRKAAESAKQSETASA